VIKSFSQAFIGTFLPIADIAVVMFAAGFLMRRRFIKQAHIDGLSAVTITVFFPCMIFANILKNFKPEAFPFWWLLPLVAVIMAVAGLGLSGILFWRDLPAKRNMLPLAAMGNASYLVLPLGLQLFPGPQFETFALYCFLFLLGFTPFLWSVGKFLVTASDEKDKMSWADLFTPPMAVNVAAILLVLTGLHRWIPDIVTHGVQLMGTATVPVATFVLGAVLGSIDIEIRQHLADALRTNLVKLFALPLLMVLILYFSGVAADNDMLRRFLVIEAAVPPATNIILQVRRYGGDEHKIGSLMLVSYILSLFTLPLWVALWGLVSQ